MMDGEAVKELAAKFRGPVDLNGIIAAPNDWQLHDPAALVKPAPAAKAIAVATLGAVRDYVKANRDGLELAKLIVHVEAPNRVTIGGPLRERSRDRELFITATAQDLAEGFLGKFMPLEHFIIGLQARFSDFGSGDDRAAVLKLLSNVNGEQVATSIDDGVSQVLQTRAGVMMTGASPIQNPVRLAPFRAFREITQPISPFVLRVQTSDDLPNVSLMEADGGTWRLTAIERVREWLVRELPAEVAVLG